MINNNFDVDIAEEETMYAFLIKENILDGKFDFKKFEHLSEKALESNLNKEFDKILLKGFYSVMEQLNIMSFDEEDLPDGRLITL